MSDFTRGHWRPVWTSVTLLVDTGDRCGHQRQKAKTSGHQRQKTKTSGHEPKKQKRVDISDKKQKRVDISEKLKIEWTLAVSPKQKQQTHFSTWIK